MRWFILLLLFFGAIINYADKSIIGLAAVHIMKEFDLTHTQWGLVGSSYYWLFPVTGIIGAAWADRIGVKKVLGFMMLTWTVLQVGVLAIAALPLLIIYRILLGAFEAPYSPIAFSHLDKWFPPKQKGFVNSVIISGNSIGTMVIAPLLVALIAIFGWKVAFAVLGGASLVWFIVFQFTKEKPDEIADKVEKEQMKKLEKLNKKDFLLLLASPTALLTTLATFSTHILIVWNIVWQPMFLVEVVGLSLTQMGYSMAIIGVVSILIYMCVSMLSDYLFNKTRNWRLSRVYVIALSMVLGALFYASIVVYKDPIWVVIALAAGKGLIFAILPIGPTIMINEMPERGGLMSSILTSVANIAGIISPILTGFIISLSAGNEMTGYNNSILVMIGLVSLFAILFGIFVKPSSNAITRKEV